MLVRVQYEYSTSTMHTVQSNRSLRLHCSYRSYEREQQPVNSEYRDTLRSSAFLSRRVLSKRRQLIESRNALCALHMS